jgi:hypothetical protein
MVTVSASLPLLPSGVGSGLQTILLLTDFDVKFAQFFGGVGSGVIGLTLNNPNLFQRGNSEMEFIITAIKYKYYLLFWQ